MERTERGGDGNGGEKGEHFVECTYKGKAVKIRRGEERSN
jgi:hypothetical protein